MLTARTDTPLTYRVVFLYHGERHHVLTSFPTRAAAYQTVREMRDDRWTCWVEENR